MGSPMFLFLCMSRKLYFKDLEFLGSSFESWFHTGEEVCRCCALSQFLPRWSQSNRTFGLIIEAQCCTVCTLFLSASDATKLGPDLIANHDMRGCRVAVVPIGADLFAQKGVLRTSVF